MDDPSKLCLGGIGPLAVAAAFDLNSGWWPESRSTPGGASTVRTLDRARSSFGHFYANTHTCRSAQSLP